MIPGTLPTPDHLEIAVRCYADNGQKPWNAKPATRAENYTLVFDCETTTDETQALRFGSYQFRRGQNLLEAGLFYDPETLSDTEANLVEAHAAQQGLRCLPVSTFVDKVFYGRAYDLGARIAGFNLPFDISRLAKDAGSARGAFRGGFTFRLSDDKRRPNVQVKSIDSKMALIQFAAQFRQKTPRGMRKRGVWARAERGAFVDVRSLASAMLSGSHSLESLSKLLKVECQKEAVEAHGGPITAEYLAYCLKDVEATWQCLAALEASYNTLELETPINRALSEASIGKASLAAMGIVPWRNLQPDFPKELLGKIVSTYYGGRSEVHIRRQIARVVYCDFVSMYPTVCTKMGLWRFVIASKLDWRNGTQEVREFLQSATADDFKNPATWKKLTAIVRIKPDTDLFPVRADYAGDGGRTIGLNYLTSNEPLYFTLADCVAAKLLTGKTPEIEEATIFEPGPVQPNLKPINVRGNPAYQVDPTLDDFFKVAIELRQATKTESKTARSEDKERLEADQQFLKILANSTSYGIFVETNVRTELKRGTVTIYGPGSPFKTKTLKLEQPGRYYHPLLATLITGAARLLLALVEYQIGRHGLDWALCDTDSMAIARPEGMAEVEFVQNVHVICTWFDGLNPYKGGGPLLKIEDQNYEQQGNAEITELFCLAVSAKRYVLFNLVDGRPVIRKASSHGLGHLIEPYRKRSNASDLPEPLPEVLKDGTKPWHHDLWYKIIEAELAGRGSQVDLTWHASLKSPAFSRYRASSPSQLRWFKTYNAGKRYRRSVKPFNFMLMPMTRADNRKVKPVAPFDKDHAKALAKAFDRETGQPVDQKTLKAYREALGQYHLHPENKFHNGDYVDTGHTTRRHVIATSIAHIGKEADRWEQRVHNCVDDETVIDYGGPKRHMDNLLEQIRREAKGLKIVDIARLAGFSTRYVSAVLKGVANPTGLVIHALSRALTVCRAKDGGNHRSADDRYRN